MKVILAGYNVDSVVLDELKEKSAPRADVTPETLSAAYARISRDPRPVDELRTIARNEVDKARRSNQTIIFKMGHHSVAEHAVFNFDVIGISRLAIEELEKFRLCSYTEKSQRYIKLEDDFIVPEEFDRFREQEKFRRIIVLQNELYHKLYSRLHPYMLAENQDLAADRKKHSILDGWAKEDARYAVSLATLGQLGFTANARNLEYLLRRFAAQPLAELKDLRQKLYNLVKAVAPSIILFTDASDFDSLTYSEFAETAAGMFPDQLEYRNGSVELVDFTLDADDKLLAVLLHKTGQHPYDLCLARIRSLTPEKKFSLVKTVFKNMEFYDAVLREFEYVDLTFDLVVSATCFAQLKRHRMATLTVQDYTPELGVIVPPSITAVGMEAEFLDVMDKTTAAFKELSAVSRLGAGYILTNAFQRRVLFKINARELYHFSRLREDATAQWDIRFIAEKMTAKAREIMPLTCLLIGGKDAYPEVYEEVFGLKPKLEPPPF